LLGEKKKKLIENNNKITKYRNKSTQQRHV
jgi:hypothetical protein